MFLSISTAHCSYDFFFKRNILCTFIVLSSQHNRRKKFHSPVLWPWTWVGHVRGALPWWSWSVHDWRSPSGPWLSAPSAPSPRCTAVVAACCWWCPLQAYSHDKITEHNRIRETVCRIIYQHFFEVCWVKRLKHTDFVIHIINTGLDLRSLSQCFLLISNCMICAGLLWSPVWFSG